MRIDAPALDPARGKRRYAPGVRNTPWNAPALDPAMLQTTREKGGSERWVERFREVCQVLEGALRSPFCVNVPEYAASPEIGVNRN